MEQELRLDRDLLRPLAEEMARIAALSCHQDTIQNWKKLNSLQKIKPMVYFWVDQLPWHEFQSDELTLRTSHLLSQRIEQHLRRTIYLWHNLRGDMVVENKMYSPVISHDTGYGLKVEEEIAVVDAANEIVGHKYIPQISTEADIEKIQTPEVSIDNEATEEMWQIMTYLVGDVLAVEKRARCGWNLCPVDDLFTWWGIEEAMLDLSLRPELFLYAMERLTQAHQGRIDQYEQLGLISSGYGNVITGQGGLAYTDELDPGGSSARSVWGSAQAQIFAAVSPKMHEKFAVAFEKQVLERFGLSYYGCCEPLHKKIGILEQITNLRKISMSPWVDVAAAAKVLRDRYVFSHKPNPAMFAQDVWGGTQVRAEFRAFLQKTEDCIVEIIVKDVSTTRYDPGRLCDWARIAQEEIEQHLGHQ
jgi:hypothetical protein